jgi:hypothetical protein
MQSFPIIKKTQFVLLGADVSTGHILDTEFKIAMNDNQIVYLIFDALEDALIKINQVHLVRNDIEFVIYDSNQNVIKYINPI